MLSSIIHREGQSQLAQYFKLLWAGYIIAAPVHTCHPYGQTLRGCPLVVLVLPLKGPTQWHERLL